MYTLNETETDGLHYIELQNYSGSTKAQFCLSQGGRLSALVIEGTQVLANFNALSYKDNYASAILFPFVNRIKNGEYTFNNMSYKLNCNEVDKNNALHGLVYNKNFILKSSELAINKCSITICYKDEGTDLGFPFQFYIELTYTLSTSGLNLIVKVKNKDKEAFPFNLGWHPYFMSTSLFNSYLQFNCNAYLEFDDQQIPSTVKELKESMPFQIKNRKLDDGYILNSNTVVFVTPKYNLQIESSAEENFLQVYTPNDENLIAIEPMTAIPNSFNNKTGLKILEPNQEYKLQWKLKVENNQ